MMWFFEYHSIFFIFFFFFVCSFNKYHFKRQRIDSSNVITQMETNTSNRVKSMWQKMTNYTICKCVIVEFSLETGRFTLFSSLMSSSSSSSSDNFYSVCVDNCFEDFFHFQFIRNFHSNDWRFNFDEFEKKKNYPLGCLSLSLSLSCQKVFFFLSDVFQFFG